MIGEVSDDQLPTLYANALACVYPTHYEGFGLPILEAMQYGCPVITSRDPAVVEAAGGAALHAASNSEYVEMMRAVLLNGDFRAGLVSAGRARAALFSWRTTARRTHEVYEEVVRSVA